MPNIPTQASLTEQFIFRSAARILMEEGVMANDAELQPSGVLDRQRFAPSRFIGMILNPFCIIRRRLNTEIGRVAADVKGSVLDFGCGSMPYKHLFSNAHSYVGRDIMESGHPDEKKLADVYYDGGRIPFEDESFDVVFSSEVFEHVFNIDEVVDEIRRVLKPDGQLIITIPFGFPEHEEPYDFARYTSFGIKAVLERRGFGSVASIKMGNSIVAIAQLLNTYFFRLGARSGFIRAIAQFRLCAPVTVMAEALSRILPRDDSMFCGQIVTAKLQG
jgi:SAM-dependent methyltransferase